MAIGNFQQRLQDDDRNSLNLRNNPPEHDPDFDGQNGGGGVDWDSLQGGNMFQDDDDLFGGGGDDLFGGGSDDDFFGGGSQGSSSVQSDPFGGGGGFGQSSSPFGNSGGFGQSSSPFGNSGGFGGGGGFGNSGGFGQSNNPFGGPFGSPFGNPQQQQPQKDNMDKLMDGGVVVGKTFWSVAKQQIEQFKHRTFDDLGYYSRNLIITGLAVSAVSAVLMIVGGVAGIEFLQAQGIQLTQLITGLFTIGTGLISMGVAAIAVQSTDAGESSAIENIPDISQIDQTDNSSDYEDSLGDELDDLFGDDDDDFFDDDSSENEQQSDQFSTDDYDWDNEEEQQTPEPEPINLDDALDKVQENQILTRHNLLQSMLPFFPKNRPDFSDVKTIDPDQDDFRDLELITVKAIANVQQKEIEEVTTHLHDAEVGMFSYRLRFKRINQLNTEQKREALADEFVNYMRQQPKDTSVTATVELDGDYFIVTVQKGEQAVVTVGDILQKQDYRDYFENEDNKIPVIVGIDDLGNVILDDAKKFDTCMIIGKPRSGKSWYVFNMLMNMMAFNSPEDIQFIIIDPKQANLFFKLAYMPHVIGLHDDKRVLDIMQDIIENEGERRKKLLKDNECDDIWGLRRKGIKLPILYLVIDEVITVMGNLKAQDPKKEKEFNQKLKILISELPYVGIRLMFVPHRATGLVDKTNRAMLQFVAAVRSARDEIEEGLGVTRWTRGLTKPGDMAIKMQTREDAFYARGPAIATSDQETAEIITTIAKAYYKLGVKPSDLQKTLTVAFNRDERYVREQLRADGIIQYDANKVLTDDDINRYDERNMSGAYQNNVNDYINSGGDKQYSQQRQYQEITPLNRKESKEIDTSDFDDVDFNTLNDDFNDETDETSVQQNANIGGTNRNSNWTYQGDDELLDIDDEVPDEDDDSLDIDQF